MGRLNKLGMSLLLSAAAVSYILYHSGSAIVCTRAVVNTAEYKRTAASYSKCTVL
jgi:hypothetical protein